MVQKFLSDYVEVVGFGWKFGTEEQRSHVEGVDAFRQICSGRLLQTPYVRDCRTSNLELERFRSVPLIVVFGTTLEDDLIRLKSESANEIKKDRKVHSLSEE